MEHLSAPNPPDFGSKQIPLATPTFADSYYISKIQTALSTSNIGSRNPMWNDQEELEKMRSVGMASEKMLSFNVPGNSFTSYLNERFSKRHPVSDLNIPRDPVAMMQMSLRYAFENPFVARALRIKTDFTCKDFKHKSLVTKAVDFYDEAVIDLRLKYLLRKIVFNLYACGVAPVYWGGEEGGPIKFLQVLDPRSVVIEEIFGKHKMWIKIDDAMVAAVRDPEGKENPRNRTLYRSLPKYWIKQIQAYIEHNQTNGIIELPDGCYSVIENRYACMSRTVNTLDGIPLQPAFDALQRYRLLVAGDFAVAWNVKNMITLISEGDPKSDSKTYIPSDTTRLNNLAAQFAKPDYSLVVFCDPTTEIRYCHPPLEVFDPKKYAQVEKELKEVLNLPSFMWMSGGNENYASAIAELKIMREEVEAVRVLLNEQFFRPFYRRLRTGDARPGFAQSDIVLPTFDINTLRDDQIWLEARQQQYSVGALSLHSLIETFGDDPDYELGMLKREHKDLNTNLEKRDNPTHAQPIFEPSQGNQNPEPPMQAQGGRPRKPGSAPAAPGPRRPRTAGK